MKKTQSILIKIDDKNPIIIMIITLIKLRPSQNPISTLIKPPNQNHESEPKSNA